MGALDTTTEAFRALGHPARLRILAMLRTGGLCVCQITAVLDLASSTVSAHLADLRRAGLVAERKNGRWVTYSLTEEPVGTGLLERVWAMIGDTPQVAADAKLTRRLRRVPVEDLCRVDLDLTQLGLTRAVGQ